MSEPVRVLVQMRSTPSLAAAAFGPSATAPQPTLAAMAGVQFDGNYSPVPLPPAGGFAAFAAAAVPAAFAAPTYLVRAAVQPERLAEFLGRAAADASVVGVFADPRLQAVAPVCPTGPVGTDADVAERLAVPRLAAKGLDGAGVRVVIVDTGVNLSYLQQRGRQPAFDAALSWGPQANQPLGQMPVGHGTMCAYAVGIAAPKSTLVDHAVLTSTAQGGSPMEGLLSDAVQSYARLLTHLLQAPGPFAGESTPRTLVVNNSWAIFHPSWDFPAGDPQNDTHNAAHPFNILVGSLEAAGADILFAAGNCGAECPDGRCQGVTTAGILGANSHPAVLSVAGVKIDGERVGYSSQGPGRLQAEKPDLACYTHFAGSGVYPADGGTSTAAPVLAGVVAAVRRLYPASVVPPARLRDLIRRSATAVGGGFNHDYGHGIVNVPNLLAALEAEFNAPAAATPPAAAKPKSKPKPKAARRPS